MRQIFAQKTSILKHYSNPYTTWQVVWFGWLEGGDEEFGWDLGVGLKELDFFGDTAG